MPFKPDIHHRRSIRLRDYDYSRAGAYFVTICTWQRECLFGGISDGEMRLNNLGSIACAAWTDLSNHYKHIELDAFVVMPNHVHGLIVLADVQAKGAGLKPALTVKIHCLSEIVRGFKTFSSRYINESRYNPGCPVTAGLL
jgi:REP element-mobilizing transposase RayT